MNTKFRKPVFISGVAMTLLAAGVAQAQISAPIVPTPSPSGVGTPLENPRPVTPQVGSPNTSGTSGGVEKRANGSASTSFNRFDVNTDGRLSKDELKGEAVMSNRFSNMDLNGDGYLSAEEFSALSSVSSGTTRPD